LTIIKGYVEMAQQRCLTGRSCTPISGVIDEAADRAVTLVRQLLAFSRKAGSGSRKSSISRHRA